MELIAHFPIVYCAPRVQTAISYLAKEILIAVRGCPQLYQWNQEVVSPLLNLSDEQALAYILQRNWLNFSPAESRADILELKRLLAKYGQSTQRELSHYLWYHCCHYTVVLWYAVAREIKHLQPCEVVYQEEPRHVYLRVQGEMCDVVGYYSGVQMMNDKDLSVYSNPHAYFIWFLIGEERYARGTLQPWESETLRVLAEIGQE